MKKINKIKKTGLIMTLLVSLIYGGLANAADLPVASSTPWEGAAIDAGASTAAKMVIDVTSSNAYLYFDSYSIGEGFTVDYTSTLSNFTAWNKVLGSNLSAISGSITNSSGGGNINLINPSGINIHDTANINVGSFIASTLDNRISAIDKKLDKTNIEAGKLELNWDQINQRNGILIEKDATITVSNRLDFIAPGFQSYKTAPIAKATYTTADGVIFKLDSNSNIASAQSITIPKAGDVYINADILTIAYPPKNDPDIPENDLAYALQKDIKLKLIAPTDLKPYSYANYNLSGVQTAVNPIEKTKLVNQIASSDFNNENIGAIAVNNSEQRMLAANSFTPVGAAYQTDDGFTPVGAAYKVDDEQDYDFVISAPILE